MASSITTTTAFTTANMKPAAGEEVDALWGDNMADNTGFCYYKEIPVPMDEQISLNRFYSFTKRASHNALKVTARGNNTYSGAVVTILDVYADGIDITAGVPAAAGTFSYTMSTNTTHVNFLDISSLSTGSHYTVKYTEDNAGPPKPVMLWQVYSDTATY